VLRLSDTREFERHCPSPPSITLHGLRAAIVAETNGAFVDAVEKVIDIPPEVDIDPVWQALEELGEQGAWEYETGNDVHPGYEK